MAKPKPKRTEEQKKTEKTKVEPKRRILQEFQDFGESKIAVKHLLMFAQCFPSFKYFLQMHKPPYYMHGDDYITAILNMLKNAFEAFIQWVFLILVQLGSLSDSPQVNTLGRRICVYKSVRMPLEDEEVLTVTDPSHRKSCWLRLK